MSSFTLQSLYHTVASSHGTKFKSGSRKLPSSFCAKLQPERELQICAFSFILLKFLFFMSPRSLNADLINSVSCSYLKTFNNEKILITREEWSRIQELGTFLLCNLLTPKSKSAVTRTCDMKQDMFLIINGRKLSHKKQKMTKVPTLIKCLRKMVPCDDKQ